MTLPRLFLPTLLALAFPLALPALAGAATESAPAAGAEEAQVFGATATAMLLTAALFVFGLGHRSGRIKFLGRTADFMGKTAGIPGWVALPSFLAAASLITAAFGFYWDVSLHIDNGRDAGPLANPSHYFILGGLFGIFSAGWLAMVLPARDERPGPAAVRIREGWYAPVGGIMLMSCASFALLGFPLDDVQHRFFGQDVTLWGPTHLMMLGGAALSLLGIMTLLSEGRLARRDGDAGEATIADVIAEFAPAAIARRFAASPGLRGIVSRFEALVTPERARKARLISACGGFLIALSIFQAEFDYGVPQFRLLFHPVLIALAAAMALTVARIVAGPGGAIGATLFYIFVRGAITLIVGPVLGESLAHPPLYLAEAALVEVVALVVATDRPYRFGIAVGAVVGTLGVLAEYLWVGVWSPHEWPAHILPEAIALAVPFAIASGVIGGFIGGAFLIRPDVASTPRAWAAAAVSLLVIGATIGFLLQTRAPDDLRAAVTLTEAGNSGGGRAANATIRFSDPGQVRDADWLSTISWQGKEKLRVEPLERVSDGVYRSAEPLPVDGTWKTAIRLQRGDVLASAPVYMPEDTAIPAKEVPASPAFTRPLIKDRDVLQREVKKDVPGYLWSLAGFVVLAITLIELFVIGWGLSRLARRGSEGSPAPEPEAARRAPAPPPGAPATSPV